MFPMCIALDIGFFTTRCGLQSSKPLGTLVKVRYEYQVADRGNVREILPF